MAFSSDNLRTFLAVLDTGSFSAAARQLGRVPSAVSMAIALFFVYVCRSKDGQRQTSVFQILCQPSAVHETAII